MVRQRVRKTSWTASGKAKREAEFSQVATGCSGASLERRFTQFGHFLETNLEIAPSLPEAARLLSISRASFVRLFRRKTGESFVRHRNRLRLMRAAQLLAATSKPTAAIAGEAGFRDQSYLGLQFRRYFGLTPGEYRRRQAGVEA